jgi:Ice-binding-like
VPNVQQELLTAANYALLAAAGITNTGATLIAGGNIGSFPTTTIIGFTGANFTPPATTDNGNASQAQTDGHAAYLFYKALGAVGITITTADIGSGGTQHSAGAPNGTWYAGAYVSPSSIAITTPVTLDAQGDPNALFIFYSTASTITQQIAGTIILANGAQPNNVIWVVGSSWTSIGPGAITIGNILADTSITLGGGTLTGRALAGLFTSSGAITIAAAEAITAPAFGPAPGTGPTNNCLISRNLGSSVLTAWPQPTSQGVGAPKLDIIQIVNQGEGGKGLNVVLNVDFAGVVHYPAVNPTDGTRLGQYFTRLNSSATLAALSFDTWTNNPAQEDIIQVINIGGNISYWLDYVLVAHGA